MADGDANDSGSGSNQDLLAEIRRMLQGQGGGSVDDALARTIQKQSERIDELQTELRKVRAQLPAEDAVVLTPEEAETLAAYRKLGKPEELTGKLEKTEELEAKLAARDREDAFRQAAQAHGFKPPVLTRLASQDGLEIVEVKEEGEGEEKTRRAYVRKGEEGSPTALDAYASEHWSDFLPALQAEADAGSGSSEGSEGASRSSGPRMPATSGQGSRKTQKSTVDDFLSKQEERRKNEKSPLLAGARG